MNRARFGLVFAILGTLTLWGCAQNPAESNAKVRLQEEVTALTAARDQLRNELKATQATRDGLQEEVAKLRRLAKERDELLATRTTERDQNAANLETLKKGLKALMDQATSMGPAESVPVTTASLKSAGNS
jgi:outer membrane murein-binding lipoprotein Lpp